jgi:hypothetical protein
MKDGESWPREVWPGAICDDWFGVFAFYTSCLFLIASVVLLVLTVGWLARKEWRMRYRNEDWWT